MGSVGQSKVKVTSHKNIAGMGFCTLVSAGFLVVVVVYYLYVSRHSKAYSMISISIDILFFPHRPALP